MRAKYKFEIMDMGDEKIAVPVGDDARDLKGILQLNSTAALILKLLEHDTSEEAIITEIMKEYDTSQETKIREYVREYLGQLEGYDLLSHD